MLNKDQRQGIGDGSTAIQAGRDLVIVNSGISASEARQIALDVAKVTFQELTSVAKETASIRAEEITEKIIKKFETDFPAGLQKAKDPDFQYALYTVQKEYARSGDKNLGELLVDLLVDRSKQDQRDIVQIVLNESLAIVPKLTENHLAALSVIFTFRYTKSPVIENHTALGKYFDKNLLPFIPKLSKSSAGYRHMQFCGCGSIELATIGLVELLGKSYQGQFLNGFDPSEIIDQEISVEAGSQFFIQCLNDEMKLQVNANDKETLEADLNKQGISSGDKAKILSLFDYGKMSEQEIKEKLISIRPYMAEAIELWSDSPMKGFTLTSVGMAIGHTNVKRIAGGLADLAMWLD